MMTVNLLVESVEARIILVDLILALPQRVKCLLREGLVVLIAVLVDLVLKCSCVLVISNRGIFPDM